MRERLRHLNSYGILDTPPEKELDEITELASIICSTPISLITILDDKRQWFKSKKGLSISETKVQDSFCQHALHKPHELLVVNDALKDERFANNKLVTNEPHIRFYAGAPLVTNKNHVLGTLCVIDREPREFSKDQEKALKILAQKAMKIIETNQLFSKLNASVQLNVERLIKITENVPLGLFEMEMSASGKMRFTFISNGMKKINPDLNLDKWIDKEDFSFAHLHPDDIESLQFALTHSMKKEERLYHEYRVKRDSGYDWHAIEGLPRKGKNGKTIIHGAFSDISFKIEYQSTLEQIAFDISHVLRKPITTVLGLMSLIETEEEISLDDLKKYTRHIKTLSHELDEYTRRLNDVYSEKKLKFSSQTIGQNVTRTIDYRAFRH